MITLASIRRIIRPDVTGDVRKATALLARAALVRLDRGQSHAQVSEWVQHPRQWNRYGPIAAMAVATVLAKPAPIESRPEPHPCTLHTMLEALSCGDCALIAATITDCPTERAGITVADVEALLADEDVAA